MYFSDRWASRRARRAGLKLMLEGGLIVTARGDFAVQADDGIGSIGFAQGRDERMDETLQAGDEQPGGDAGGGAEMSTVALADGARVIQKKPVDHRVS